MDKILKNRELVSALADGDLHGASFATAVQMAVADEDARATWHAYHLVGDVLRSSDLTRCHVKDGFMNRLQSRLQAEASAMELRPPVGASLPEVTVLTAGAEAANASVFRWKLVAAAASLAAFGAMGWNLLGSMAETGGATLAQSTGTAVAVAPARVALSAAAGAPAPAVAVNASNDPPMVMIRDPHLDALLAAHKQFGGTSALQAPAGFLRNATFEQR